MSASLKTRRERAAQRRMYRTPIEYYIDHGMDLSLLIDQYAATMAYAWFKSGEAERPSVFNYFFRNNPFGGAYTLSAGQASVLTYVDWFQFNDSSLDYLASLNGNDGKPLFTDPAFFDFLEGSHCELEIDGMPEGSVAFPREPVLRFKGPRWQCQWFEAFVLNQMNFWSLIATKSSRMAYAANGKPIAESGFRRAHGIDGHFAAALAAIIGGAWGTSNLQAARLFDLQCYGSMAHSYILSHLLEEEAFLNFARAMPNNVYFLIDTYDIIEGTKKAAKVAKRLREEFGVELAGIRIDSGDLHYYSIECRKILDEAGFDKAKISASNDLNEYKIHDLEAAGAKFDIYAPGTALATGGEQSALGGVMKFVLSQNDDGTWDPRTKLSGDAAKITQAGMLNVRRFVENGLFIGDAIFDERNGVNYRNGALHIQNPTDFASAKRIAEGCEYQDLLVPMYRSNALVAAHPSIPDVVAHAKAQQECLHDATRRVRNGYAYPAGLTPELAQFVQSQIEANRQAV